MSGPDTTALARIADVLRDDARLERPVRTTMRGEVLEVEVGGVLVLAVLADTETAARLEPYLDAIRERRAGVVFVGDVDERTLSLFPPRLVTAALADPPGANAVVLATLGLVDRLEAIAREARLTSELHRARYEIRELTEIGRAITLERDITRLLDLILVKSRFVTGADAGSIYIAEQGASGEPGLLRFKLSQNDSVQFESAEFTIPISPRSIAGYVAYTREPISIPDVHDIPSDAPFGYDASFDRRVGYRTHSMLAVPMISAEDEVIGVIQLINKKLTGSSVLGSEADFEREVVPFDARSSELLTSVASQAGIALENAMLYDEIRKIFEGFVRASVQAIEARDPTTSGHSLRVSVLSCRLAEKVDRADSGAYRETRFSTRELKELEYASLLHDFGKIGVREQVLVKAKKLYPHVLDAIRERLFFLEKQAELDHANRKLAIVVGGGGQSDLAEADRALAERRAELAEVHRTIRDANEPTVLSEGDFTRIGELAKIEFVDGGGATRRLLDEEDVRSLSIRKGSLNDAEMDEIRSHVVHTFAFLSRIPWGKSFARVAEIAGAHHEKLNGTGYPHGKTSDAIPTQSKIMTIADIYDALTARDRPYKRAMPAERALQILDFEVKDGHVDAELMRIFRDAEVYRAVDERLEY